MAEFLVKWEDNVGDHPDTWKRGMIASPIRPDGFEWGRMELLPPDNGGKFIRIKIPGVSPEDFEKSCETELGCKPLDPEADSSRPAIRLDLDSFSTLEKGMMRSGGARTISVVDMETKINRKGKSMLQGKSGRLLRGKV